jgi:hypothetical protein
MLEESEVRAIAQKVIDQSKSSARVDTGALRRLWRTLTFVALLPLTVCLRSFGDNSKLERNAID